MVTASVRPGPAPAAHARASTAPAAASSWRVWPQVNARSHTPIVDGARTSWPNTASLALTGFEHPHRSGSEGTFLVGGPVLRNLLRWIPVEGRRGRSDRRAGPS